MEIKKKSQKWINVNKNKDIPSGVEEGIEFVVMNED